MVLEGRGEGGVIMIIIIHNAPAPPMFERRCPIKWDSTGRVCPEDCRGCDEKKEVKGVEK